MKLSDPTPDEPQSEDVPRGTSNPENTAKNRSLPPKFAAQMWKPGQSGNPGGRPKKKPLTDAYAAILDKTVPPDMAIKLKLPESATYAEVIAMALAVAAVNGEVKAAAELADRVEGKVTLPLSGPDGGPIAVRTLNDFYANPGPNSPKKDETGNS